MKKISLDSFWGVALVLGALVLFAAILRLVNLTNIPPGLYHDEAVNGLDVWNVLQGQRLPIFFDANGGREPLFLYLQALSVWLFGPSIWSLRIVSAIIGILTILAFYKFARELNLPNIDATALALIATAGLALSYWHLHWSRVGLRAISLPLCMCLSFYFYWRLRRTQTNSDALLAGIFLGLTFYTYLAARLVPLIYLAFFALDWRTTRALWRNYMTLGISACVVAAPLAFYFFQNPDALFSRTSDIALGGGTAFELLQALGMNLTRVLGMFFVSGDLEWRHGIAFRPVLDPFAAILFALGLLVALKSWREPAARFAWIVLGVMVLPTILSQAAPDNLRAIGALAILYWFVALGWMQISAWLAPRVRWTQTTMTLLGVGLLIFVSGFFTVRDYFGTWANEPRAYRDFDGEFTEIANWLNRQTENVYVPLSVYAYPTVQFLTLTRAPQISAGANLNELAAQGGLVFPTREATAQQFVVLRDGQVNVLEPLQFSNLDIVETLQGRYRTLTNIYRASSDAFVLSQSEIIPLEAKFEGIELLGYSLASKTLAPHQPLEIVLDWQRTGQVAREPLVFLNLMDAQGNSIARATEPLTQGISIARYPLQQIIPDAHTLQIPNSLAPGAYTLEFGLYDSIQEERLDAQVNRATRDYVAIQLGVPFPNVTLPNDLIATQARWANGIALKGYTVDTMDFRAGESSAWNLYWTSAEPQNQDYTIFVQLVHAQGEIVAQADHDPMLGANPTTLWQPNQNIADNFSLMLPENLVPGEYQLKIGLYDRATNERAELHSPAASDNAFSIPIQVAQK